MFIFDILINKITILRLKVIPLQAKYEIMTKDETIFRLRIKEILDEKGLSQKEFAEMMGKSPQYISNILNADQGVSVNILIEFAKTLQVDFRDLFASTKEDRTTTVTCPHCGKPIEIELKKEHACM